MSTIAEKLTAIAEAKEAIKVAIEAKGVEVANAPLSEYPAKIESIQAGGGGKIKPTTISFQGSPADVIDVDMIDFSNITNAGQLFSGCTKLKRLILTSRDDISRFNSLSSFASGCTNLEEFEISSEAAVEATNAAQMLSSCPLLKRVVIRLTLNKCRSFTFMFSASNALCDLTFDVQSSAIGNCSFEAAFQSTSISEFKCFANKDMKFASSLSRICYMCSSLRIVDFSGADLSQTTSVMQLVGDCRNLEEAYFVNTKLSKLTDLYATFSGCSSLRIVDFSGADLSALTQMRETFDGCTSLATLYISLRVSCDVSSCPLSHTSLMYIINNAKDLAGGTAQTLTLGSTNLAKLTDDEKAIIIAKNWTLA